MLLYVEVNGMSHAWLKNWMGGRAESTPDTKKQVQEKKRCDI